ncbi:MAG: PAS domain-containing protein, partial [Sandaracinaceae bacterium]|nr:PAS domain-containing protein [Sandaracinaceae bacterium]
MTHEAANEGLFVLGREGGVEQVDDAALALLEARVEQVRGQPLASLVAPDDRPSFDAALRAAAAGK